MYRIDWQRFFVQVHAFLDTCHERGRGGVVLIRGDSDAAPDHFASLLRTELRSLSWQTPLLDLGLGDATIDEVCTTLLGRFRIPLPASPTAIIGAGTINTEGPVTFEGNMIYMPGDPYSQAASRERCKELLSNALTLLLPRQRVALFLQRSEDTDVLLRRFWSALWTDCLDAQVPKGLVFIQVAGSGEQPMPNAPSAELVIDLPSVYSPEERAIALTDMVNIMKETPGPNEDLNLVCHNVLVSARDQPFELYRLFPLHILDRRLRSTK